VEKAARGYRFRFVVINPKTQVAERQVLFPLVYQRLRSYDEKVEKRGAPVDGVLSSAPDDPSDPRRIAIHVG
jgi:hypothetical protein